MASGTEILDGARLAALCTGNFREDPSIDYGRVIRRTPRAVVRPRDRDALRACMQFLYAAGIPYTTRGAGHSSGGQALIDERGVVLDLRHLDRIVRETADTITVEGNCWWLRVVEHLHAQGRRPRSITANLRTAVAGTLAVGGFGDSAHLHGLQISHVTRITLITPDGAEHELGPDDELLRYSLAGRAQLGVIADVTLQTIAQPWTMLGRILRWDSLAAFVRDSDVIAEHAIYDFVRARVRVAADGSEQVVAHVGRTEAERASGFRLQASGPEEQDGLAMLRPASATAAERIDLYALLAEERPDDALACPALELVLPLPDGLAAWRELAGMITRAGLPALQPEGHSVMIVARDDRFPLAPLPAPRSIMIAIRPKLPVADAPALLPALRAIGRRAMQLGARIYLMSIELDDPDFLARQFGDALARLRALKAQVDPRGLLNPGLL